MERTSSPGSSTASRLAIMPSVAPQQTVISRSGSNSMPQLRWYLAAMASRKGLAPQVMAYWLMSASMAWTAALFRTAGAGKIGEALRQINGPVPHREAGHLADHGFGELGDPLAAESRAQDSGVGRHHSRLLCREGGLQAGIGGGPGTDRAASEFPANGAGNPWQSCQSPGSIGDHVDLPDTALDFDVDFVRGAFVSRADPMSFFLLESADADAADAAVGLGINPGIRRNANRGFADTPMDGDVVAVLGRAAQIHIHLTDAHVQFHAAEVEAAQIEPRLAGAEVEGKFHRSLFVELQIPVVFRVAEPGVVRVRLFDGQ